MWSNNLCVESHIRNLLECDLKVKTIKYATGGSLLPIGGGFMIDLSYNRNK